MRIKEEMEKLGADIIGSYDVRVEKIGQIKKETEEALKSSRDLLKNFQNVHKKMSLEQRENLSKYKENLEEDTQKMIDDFKVSHSQMSKELKNDLNKFNQGMKSKVSGMLNDFHSTQQEMSLEQRKNLAKGVENRKEEVSKTLDDFKVSHSQMSKELKNDLNKFNQGMKSKVSGMLNDFRSTQDKLRAELEKVSLSWQQTASTLQEKRSGVKPLSVVREKKIVNKELPKPEQNKIKENLSEKQQTLDLIIKHPQGIKLAEIGAVLGKDWRWYIITVKELMEENKIRKEENLYYPMI